ncbi:MAG TPA: hypothetical protein PKV27_05785 [Ilumatobacteraceae bacterium]|nr:hypothetical protein [Ilumatobacteraceae bacterium]
MTALTIASAKNLALVIVVGLAVLAVISFWVIKNITTKLVMALILAGLALGVWNQRDELRQCGRNLQEQVKLGSTSNLACTFFGIEVKLDD